MTLSCWRRANAGGSVSLSSEPAGCCSRDASNSGEPVPGGYGVAIVKEIQVLFFFRVSLSGGGALCAAWSYGGKGENGESQHEYAKQSSHLSVSPCLWPICYRVRDEAACIAPARLGRPDKRVTKRRYFPYSWGLADHERTEGHVRGAEWTRSSHGFYDLIGSRST